MKSITAVSILVILFTGCKQSGQTGSVENTDPDKINSESYFSTDHNNAPQHISSVPVPKTIVFAGDTIPLNRPDVREALESELMVNTFRHSRTLAIIKNVERWRPFVLAILEKEGIPADFLYVAVVESEFDNNAQSPVGAVGMWQMMEQTAKEYGLRINNDADMRRDPKQATEAAAKFLKKAHAELKNWTLTAASYNVGIQGVKNRLNDQKVDNFFDLHLNSETARYVYRIIAFKLILENPNAYGYFVPEEERYKPYKFTTIMVDDDVKSLVDLAKKYNTTYKQLRLLNPWFNNTENFQLKVKKKEVYEIRIPSSEKN